LKNLILKKQERRDTCSICKISIFLFFLFFIAAPVFSRPADVWKTAVRPDYAAVDSYVLKCGPDCGKTPEEVADKITAECTSDIEKARAVFDWLAYTVAYDTSYRISSPDEAFRQRRSVCQGYAMLFCRMAEHAGLKVELISGEAKNNMFYRPGTSLGQGGGHAWNIVRLVDRDIIVDPTWGAGYVHGGRFCRFFQPWWFDPHPAAAVFTHLPPDPSDELLEPPVSGDLFRELPYIQPDLAYSGLDPCEIYSFFSGHPECGAVLCYDDFDQAVSQGIRIEKMPLCSVLKSGTEYEFRYRPSGEIKVRISGSRETQNDDGSVSLYFQGKNGTRITVGWTKGNGILLSYTVSSAQFTFSKRTVIAAESPQAVRRPDPVSVVMDFVGRGSTPVSGFFMSSIESAEEQWKQFERDSGFSAAFFHKDKILRKKYRFNPSWMPAVGFTLDQVAAYCNWKSAAEGLKPCYALGENGEIVCDFSAGGYRVPRYDEWLYAATGGTDTFPETEDMLAECAWYSWDSGGIVHTEGERNPNVYGIHDLFGNVPEICFDAVSGTYVTAGGGAGDTYEDIKAARMTPAGPDGILNGCIRVVRNAPADAAGMAHIGAEYLNGGGLDQDYAKALTWINAAVAAGSISAVNSLGYMYANGYGVDQDTEKAVSYFKSAAEQGDVNGCFNTGFMLDKGIGQKQDKTGAVVWYRKAAELGSGNAQYILACAYADGESIPEDPGQAFYWMDKSAAGGNDDAVPALALYYKNGYGTEKNEGRALELFLRLARKGSVFGMNEAAACFAAGAGTKQNWSTALYWYRKAEKAGSADAGEKIAECLYYGRGTDRNIDAAVEKLKELHDSGQTDADELLARAVSVQAWLIPLADTGKLIQANIPAGADPFVYKKSFTEMDAVLKELTGKEPALPLLFNGMSADDIQKKTVAPLHNMREGTPFPVRSKLLLIIVPPDYTKSGELVQTVCRTDALASDDRRMNGERYRFDQPLSGQYDILIPIRYDSVSSMMSALMPCMDNSMQTDVLDLDVVLFSTAAQKNAPKPVYQSCLHDLWKEEIDRGLHPRLIWFGDTTGNCRQRLDGVFTGSEASYAGKIHMFGTPFAMSGELSLGFRSGRLLVCLLSKPFAADRAFRVYLDESGSCQGAVTKAPTCVPDIKLIPVLKSLKKGASATISCPDNVTAVFAVVHPVQ